jgi:hypothetical protein
VGFSRDSCITRILDSSFYSQTLMERIIHELREGNGGESQELVGIFLE